MELQRPVSDQPATAVQIASLLLGQGDQNLGRSATLEPGDFKARIILQNNLLDNPSAGEMITLHLRAERESFDFPEVAIATPIGELEFGHGGERNTKMLLDFDSGTQISFPAGSMRLTARMPEDVIALDSVSCGAFIARGTRGDGSCCSGPHYTIRFQSNGVFVNDQVIPVGAKNLMVWEGLAQLVERVWLDNVGTPMGFFTVDPFQHPPAGPVNVPPTARSVATVGQHPLTLVFGLEG